MSTTTQAWTIAVCDMGSDDGRVSLWRQGGRPDGYPTKDSADAVAQGISASGRWRATAVKSSELAAWLAAHNG